MTLDSRADGRSGNVGRPAIAVVRVAPVTDRPSVQHRSAGCFADVDVAASSHPTRARHTSVTSRRTRSELHCPIGAKITNWSYGGRVLHDHGGQSLLHTFEPLGDGVASPSYEGAAPLHQELKRKHGIDYDSHASYRFIHYGRIFSHHPSR
jgi:hypothetical protein